MDNPKLRLVRWTDALLIAGALAAAAVLFVLQAARPVGQSALVLRDGEVLLHIDLSDLSPRSYPVDGDCPLVIVTANGEVWFAESDCPDQICVRSGHLTAAGDTAACLPARVVLRVEGMPAQDGFTG